MSFQWVQLRISEEKDRRDREAQIRQRLPLVLEELHRALSGCVESYTAAFGAESVGIVSLAYKIKITLREEREGKWQKTGQVEISTVPALPGLHIDRNGDPLDIEVGLLPGEKTYYKEGEQFLSLDDLTRRILDRALFPKLTTD